MRRTFALLAAAAAVAVPVGTASANDAPSPVTVSTNGVCPSGYREIARVSTVVVCLTTSPLPGARPTTTGCAPGETGILVEAKYGVCVR